MKDSSLNIYIFLDWFTWYDLRNELVSRQIRKIRYQVELYIPDIDYNVLPNNDNLRLYNLYAVNFTSMVFKKLEPVIFSS